MKTKIILLLLLCVAPLTMLFGQTKQIRKANRHYKSFEYAEAIPHYKDAFEKDGSELALLRLAICYRELANYKEAANTYAEIIKREELRQDIHYYYYALMLKASGRYEEARQNMKEYVRLAPGDDRGKKMLSSIDYAIRLSAQKPIYGVNKLDAKINASDNSDDYTPVKYNNGIIFASSRSGSTGESANDRSGQSFTDLYFAEQVSDKEFRFAAKFSSDLNTTTEDGPATFDARNKYIYFSRAVNVRTNPDLNAEGIYKLKLFQAKLDNGRWVDVKELPFNSNRYNCTHPSVSPDGKILYFCSDKPGGYGGKDIYKSEYDSDDNEWSSPVNLGDSVNTEGNEMFPYVHSDGSLYFSSDFHPGLGGLDVYKASLDKDGKVRKREHLMPSINSVSDDFGVLINADGESGFVSSRRNSSEGVLEDNIYYFFKIKPDDPDKEPLTLIVSGTVVEVLCQKNGSEWSRTQGGALENALVMLMKDRREVDRRMTNPQGKFAFNVDKADDYVLVTKKNGYYKKYTPVTSRDILGKTSDYTIQLEKIVLHEPDHDSLPNILFDYDQHSIKDSASIMLERVLHIMSENPEIKLEVAGHTCPMGTDYYNDGLSRRRANSAADYLLSGGKSKISIDPNRVSVRGYGEKQLITKNPKEYYLNRRAEFIVRSVDFQAGQVDQESAAYYTVKVGDTVFSIAKQYGVGIEQLKSMNNLTSNMIKVGQKLRVR